MEVICITQRLLLFLVSSVEVSAPTQPYRPDGLPELIWSRLKVLFPGLIRLLPKFASMDLTEPCPFFSSTDQLPPEYNQTLQHFLLPSALWTQSWSNMVSVMDYPWSALNSRNRTTLGVTLSLSMWALKYLVDNSACVGMLAAPHPRFARRPGVLS